VDRPGADPGAQQLTVADADTLGESLGVPRTLGQLRRAAVTGGVC
jgi:hypothetical protein